MHKCIYVSYFSYRGLYWPTASGNPVYDLALFDGTQLYCMYTFIVYGGLIFRIDPSRTGSRASTCKKYAQKTIYLRNRELRSKIAYSGPDFQHSGLCWGNGMRSFALMPFLWLENDVLVFSNYNRKFREKKKQTNFDQVPNIVFFSPLCMAQKAGLNSPFLSLFSSTLN